MERFIALYRGLQALLVAALAGSFGGPQAAAQDDLPVDPADAAAWEAARAIGTEAACQGYLDQYPTGRYAEEAFRCIIEATLPAAGPITPPSVDRRRPPPVPDDSDDDGCGDRGGGECLIQVVPEAKPEVVLQAEPDAGPVAVPEAIPDVVPEAGPVDPY